MNTTAAAEVMAELAALEDPKVRAINERHGDDHGVNLSKLRAIAKRLKTQHPLAVELWKRALHLGAVQRTAIRGWFGARGVPRRQGRGSEAGNVSWSVGPVLVGFARPCVGPCN